MEEGASVVVTDSVIELATPQSWTNLGFSLLLENSHRERSWRLRAPSRVGSIRLRGRRGRELQIRVLPKLPGLSVGWLLETAWFSGRNPFDEELDNGLAGLEGSTETYLMACGRFLLGLRRLARRGLPRQYIVRERMERGRIRGRVIENQYLRQSLWRGQPHYVPCRQFVYDSNHSLNGILSKAVQCVRERLAWEDESEPVDWLAERVQEVSRLLDGVVPQVPDTRVMQRIGSQRNLSSEYKQLVRQSCEIIQGMAWTEDSLSEGPATLWDLSSVFEAVVRKACTALIERIEPARSIRFVDSEGTTLRTEWIRPDIVGKNRNGSIIVDAKYKANFAEMLGSNSIGRSGINRDDIYQMIAYSNHRQLAANTAIMVYPVVLKAGEEFPRMRFVDGFQTTVGLLGMDVGPNAGENFERFGIEFSKTAG